VKRRGKWAIGIVVLALGAVAAYLWTPDLARDTLEAKYLAEPDDMVDVAGTRLHVRDTGPSDAPAVIMIHGFGSSLQTWEGWAQALGDSFRVIRFDLPGAALSPPDPTGDYTDARTMEIIDALMDDLGLARAHLIGNSIGGRIAWMFAANRPDRVGKLILVAPDGYASQGRQYGETPEIPLSLTMLQYVLPRPFLRESMAPSYGDPSALTEDRVDVYHDLLRAPGSRPALIARIAQSVLPEPEPLLRSIAAPTLLVWGAKDAMIPVSNAQDYLRELPDARLVRFDDLGHVPQEEAPQRTVAPVRAFLEE